MTERQNKDLERYADNLRWTFELLSDATDARFSEERRMRAMSQLADREDLREVFDMCCDIFRDIANRRTDKL